MIVWDLICLSGCNFGDWPAAVTVVFCFDGFVCACFWQVIIQYCILQRQYSIGVTQETGGWVGHWIGYYWLAVEVGTGNDNRALRNGKRRWQESLLVVSQRRDVRLSQKKGLDMCDTCRYALYIIYQTIRHSIIHKRKRRSQAVALSRRCSSQVQGMSVVQPP